MEIKEGIYVRTEEGKIFKTDGDEFHLSNNKKIFYRLLTRIPYESASYKVIKTSYNIIDLIEVGDYVNDERVIYIDDCEGAMRQFYLFGQNPEKDGGYWNEEIKSIVTHEQFDNIKYEV